MGECPPAAARHAPANVPIMNLAMRPRAAVRLGVFGSRSATYSPSANNVRMPAVTGDDTNENHVAPTLRWPRYAAHARTADEVNDRSPVENPIKTMATIIMRSIFRT